MGGMALHFKIILGCLVSFFLFPAPFLVRAVEPHLENRSAMVRTILREYGETASILGKNRPHPRVEAVLATIPRHEFVPRELSRQAYLNRPLPIGHGQTISQPFIVAVMTDLLDIDVKDRVLEVGTGSGYQAAILAGLASEVYTIEIIEPLGRQAEKRFESLGFSNVNVHIGDGYFGWPDKAPFDAIIVTAAASHIPPPLVKQLGKGGRMIIPVGSRFMVQQLILITKNEKGELLTRQILPVQFVPLTGGHD